MTYKIKAQEDNNIELSTSGIGYIVLNDLKWPNYDGIENQVLTTDGSGNLRWSTGGGGSGTGTVTSIDVSGGTTGLITSGGPVTSNGTITLSGTLEIANGGTGETNAVDAANALLPDQSGHAGQALTTDGAGNLTWQQATIPIATTTDLGGIIVGDGLSVDLTGVLSVKPINVIDLVPVSGFVTIDVSLAQNFRLLLTENITINEPINAVDGIVINLQIQQGMAGALTVTWAPNFSWPYGSSPIVSTVPLSYDFISMFYDGSSMQWRCVINQAFSVPA